MPLFYYKAKNKSAETINGEVLAQTKDEAIEKINFLGLIPVMISDTPQMTASTAAAKQQNSSRGRISVKEVSVFSRQLASLLKTGIPLLRALEILEKQTGNAYFRSVLGTVGRGIKDGQSLADALVQHPNIFSPLYVAMINSGEESGQLREMLSYMADYLKSQDEVASKVKTAMVYPLVLLCLGIGTVIFLLAFVMPRVTNLFGDMKQVLPLPTVIVIHLSEFLRKSWLFVAVFVLSAVLLVKKGIATPAGHRMLSSFQLNLPVWGPLILKAEMAWFCRSMEMLLKSGVSILRAIKLSVPLIGNDILREQFERCHKDLMEGRSMGRSLKHSRYVPSMVGDMIAIGEESGSLSSALQNIADDYEQDVRETIRVLTTLLEPLMIVVVGSIIGFMVIAMLLPIFQLDIYSR